MASRGNAIPKVVAAHKKDLNVLAFGLLAPEGMLVTCSRSRHFDEMLFGGLVAEAANDAKVRALLIEKRLPCRDHPVLLGVPETAHLKCLVVRRIGRGCYLAISELRCRHDIFL